MHRHYAQQTELDMNCIPGSGIRLITMAFLIVTTCSIAVSAAETVEAGNHRVYGADYSIVPDV